MQAPIKDSARISSLELLEFSYPLDPVSRTGQAKFSAFGKIGGIDVNAEEQPINFDEGPVFILADKNGIQLVSRDSFYSREAIREE
ncbi:hypothetical protein V7152_28280 [Neobacillus drentensis]